MSLQEIVGKKTYTVGVDMLGHLVPDGRAHRLAPLIAGMLVDALDVAREKHGEQPEEGTAAHALLAASEMYDPDAAVESLLEVLDGLFDNAGVQHERVSSRGDEYSVAESAVYEFIHWYDGPWET